MLEQQTIKGRKALVHYLKHDMTPSDKDTAELVKVRFEDDGTTLYLKPPKDDDQTH